MLVKRAEEEVKKRGGRRFLAYIQSSKVEFFERCAWRRVKKIPDFHGRPHVLMLAAGPIWEEGSLPRHSGEMGADLQRCQPSDEAGSAG